MSSRKPISNVPSRAFFAKSVGSFVPRLTQKAFEKYGFSTASLLMDWANIVGDDLGRSTAPERLKWPKMVSRYADVTPEDRGRPGATLVLRVAPAKALDVQYSADQIVDRINQYFGYRAVERLRFLQAPVDHVGKAARVPPAPKRRDYAGNALSKASGAASVAPHVQVDGPLGQSLERLKASFQA